jgi:NADH dehydrogenase
VTTPLKKIVIVGGGAGGLELATQLGKKLGRHKKAKITLVDRNHSHLWKPLLHEVATGSLDEGVDALSYLAHARNHGFQFQLGSVVDINREGKPSPSASCVMKKASCWWLSVNCRTTRW